MRRRWMSSDRMTIQSLKRNIPVINLLQIIVAFLVFHCCSTQSQFSRPSYLNEQEVGKLVAVIADEDTVTGFLLAGVGHRTASGSNFLVVKSDTKLDQVEEAFQNFSTRDDIGIILINQHIANDIRHVLKDYNATIPTVLEIPSKEHPYDPEQDYIMQRVNMFLGVAP